jgi:hypothetical protein
MNVRLPRSLLDHPIESAIAAGLLLTLLLGAADTAPQKAAQNQSSSACHEQICPAG